MKGRIKRKGKVGRLEKKSKRERERKVTCETRVKRSEGKGTRIGSKGRV